MTADDAPIRVRTTYHLAPEEVWANQAGAAAYRPEAFETEGFIHCTDGEAHLIAVANAYYRGDHRPYVALVIDLERVAAPVRYEDPERIYPHIYGELNRDAVIAVCRVGRLDDGSFAALT